MSMSHSDREVLRDLAKRYADVAALPIMAGKAELWRRLNRLEPVRPMVILMNGTWHETASEISLVTEDPFAREQEWHWRSQLYHWEHMPDDHVYEAVVRSPIAIQQTDIGLRPKTTDPNHVFGARHYHTVIEDDADPDIIAMPEISVDQEQTERTFGLLSDLYGDIMPVRKSGVGAHWFDIMDDFIQWRGIQQTFVDMVDRPQWVHAWLDRLTQWELTRLEQWERLGLLELNNNATGIGSGGLGFTDELPQPDFDGVHVRAKDQWGHATTQIFSEVSPRMHEEFAIAYERRFLERFGLSYYGCCEPLHHKVDIISTMPNVRKISMSPRCDIARGAEAIGDRFVFSWKPNPAIIGMESWHEDLVRKQLGDALDRTRGCAVEILMKDLHTCRGEPWRMWEWVRIAMEMAQEYGQA